MKSEKKAAFAKISLFSAMIIMGATPMLHSSLSDSILYSTDFHTSSNSISTGYTYTTNGATGSGGAAFYFTNSRGVATQWATTTTGQDGWVSSATPNAPSAPAAGPGVNNYIGSYPTPYFQSYGGDSYYSTDFTNSYTYPQSATNYMYQASYANTHSNALHFDSTFSMYGDPTTPNNNGQYDTLGWTLLNSAGNALVSINLSTTNVTNGWNLSASSFASDGTNNQVLKKANGTAIGPLTNNQVVHLGFDIAGIGTAQQTITVLNYTNISSTPGGAYTVLGTNLISGYDFSGIAGGTNVASFADTWVLQDQNTFQNYTNAGVVTTGYGDYAVNSLQMSSLVVAVPEPKTWILFGLSGLVLVVVLRRRAS